MLSFYISFSGEVYEAEAFVAARRVLKVRLRLIRVRRAAMAASLPIALHDGCSTMVSTPAATNTSRANRRPATYTSRPDWSCSGFPLKTAFTCAWKRRRAARPTTSMLVSYMTKIRRRMAVSIASATQTGKGAARFIRLPSGAPFFKSGLLRTVRCANGLYAFSSFWNTLAASSALSPLCPSLPLSSLV